MRAVKIGPTAGVSQQASFRRVALQCISAAARVESRLLLPTVRGLQVALFGNPKALQYVMVCVGVD